MTKMTENLLAIHLQTATKSSSNNDSIERLIERSNSTPSERCSSSKRKRYEELPPNVQLVLRRMSIVNIYDEEPLEPASSYIDIIGSSNKTQPISFITSLLKSKKVLGRWGTGHISKFIFSGPLWLEHDDPFGLTMLGICCSGKADTGVENSLKFSLQQHMDDKLDKNDVAMLIKNELFLPQSVHEIKIVLETYEAILSIICSPGAILPQMMRGWVNHFNSWFEAYRALFMENTSFGIRLLYAIDLSIQMYLDLLSDESTPACEIPRYHIENKMQEYKYQIQRRQFNTRIPNALLSKAESKRKNKDQINDGNQNNNYKRDQHSNNQNSNNNNNNNNYNSINNSGNNTNRQNKRNDHQNKHTPYTGNPAKNNNLNNNWKLPADKQFHNCFCKDKQRNTQVPKFENREFCIKYLVMGECRMGSECKYLHKDPRDCGLETQFDTFCKSAFNNN
jgi:hypothetical protein